MTARSLLTWHNVAAMVLVTAGHVWSQTWSWLATYWNCCFQHERADCCEAGTARRCQSESQLTFYEQHCNCNHMKGAAHVIAWCAGWQRTLPLKYEGFLRVSTDHAGYCVSLCVTCWLLVLLFGCVRWYSACYWPPALRARWSLQWLLFQFLYQSTVPCICCVHQQSTSAVLCCCSCWYWI